MSVDGGIRIGGYKPKTQQVPALVATIWKVGVRVGVSHMFFHGWHFFKAYFGLLFGLRLSVVVIVTRHVASCY